MGQLQHLRRIMIYRVLAFLILILAIWLGANFWEVHIREEESAKVISVLDAAWTKTLRHAGDRAQAQLTAAREKNETDLRAVRRRLDSALTELLNRPSRAEQAQLANRACPAVPACTGAGLAREDAEFLTRESAAAAEQQSRLREARAGYETCRQALRSVTSGTAQGDSHGDQAHAPAGVPGD